MKHFFSQNDNMAIWIYLTITVLLLASACSIKKAEETQPLSSLSEAEQNLPTIDITMEESSQVQNYMNEQFGLSFQFPADWFGPDVYEWEDGVRVSIGSDVVYPYGTSREEQKSTIENSYSIVIQYENLSDSTLNNDTYESILELQDGESIETARSLTTRVRSLNVGSLSGVEYIATLPKTAQTEFFYTREVILYDQDNHLITLTGSPNNVKIVVPGQWREAFQRVDDANQEIFYAILNSITIS